MNHKVTSDIKEGPRHHQIIEYKNRQFSRFCLKNQNKS